jgi:hypothetical protein
VRLGRLAAHGGRGGAGPEDKGIYRQDLRRPPPFSAAMNHPSHAPKKLWCPQAFTMANTHLPI